MRLRVEEILLAYESSRNWFIVFEYEIQFSIVKNYFRVRQISQVGSIGMERQAGQALVFIFILRREITFLGR